SRSLSASPDTRCMWGCRVAGVLRLCQPWEDPHGWHSRGTQDRTPSPGPCRRPARFPILPCTAGFAPLGPRSAIFAALPFLLLPRISDIADNPLGAGQEGWRRAAGSRARPDGVRGGALAAARMIANEDKERHVTLNRFLLGLGLGLTLAGGQA